MRAVAPDLEAARSGSRSSRDEFTQWQWVTYLADSAAPVSNPSRPCTPGRLGRPS
ncbi:hypothetical protein Amsp01_078950 [Amycolatopsis sp. NBRC 101858]|uniref:hypothetical protein n=1 Tax=Amycolatopsis sp. NBRC 101858 TaxID=3032200 RepID=UPI0024A5DC91|nr:hypothetical protein [Amycolatopsis sp. NBRC 101858]GLY41872.1 hypothetical protein Amsp01_078950 [Amycolatopsis sp. NBRC 101858]